MYAIRPVYGPDIVYSARRTSIELSPLVISTCDVGGCCFTGRALALKQRLKRRACYYRLKVAESTFQSLCKY